MEQFTIQTSQNISIEQSMASIGERILAAIIDFAIMGSYIFITLIVTGLIRNSTVVLIFGFPLLFYHLVFEQAMNGQSPGKNVMKIRVVSEDGTAASFTSIFIRWVFRIIDVTIMLGSIATFFIIATKKNQRLGDLAGHTILLRTKQKKMSGSMYINLPKDYKLQFPEVSCLSENDLKIVKEVLGFLKKSNMNHESGIYATKTKLILTKKMGIESTQKPELFLINILKDYNYIHSENYAEETMN